MVWSAHLDEDSEAVIGVSSGVQVVFVFLCDMRHHHGDQRLHRVIEGRRETLAPGNLQDTAGV